MTAVCHRCGERWARHPALEVECPKCHATVGVGCCRPSGHAGPLIEPHIEREQRAVDEGVLELCTQGLTRKAGTVDEADSPRHSDQLALL